MKNYDEVNIFDGVVPYYKITKPVRLIECFAGIGSQHQALKKLGVKIDRSTIVEWQVNSIKAYNDIHIRTYDDHTQGMSKEEIAKKIFDFGVSINYDEPAKLPTLLRKGDEWLKNVYNNIINTNNKVNIMNVKASDLNITETDKYDYILTYSFPCQDLSIAGLRKGMSDNKTRSGLLWEVERILQEIKDNNGELPQVLLMENVPDVIGSSFIKEFQKWELKLQELGYSNHTEILNAKDYGVPQNRQRAFMVSILGNYLYRFPRTQKLERRLRDVLEDKVDEKYYLTQEKIDAIKNWKAQQDPFENLEKTTKSGISPTLTARGAGEEHSGMILVVGNYMPSNHNASVIVDTNGIAPTVMENHGTVTAITESLFTDLQAKMITPDGNVKRYIDSDIVDVFNEGDCADISFPNGYDKGNRVQKQISPTLTTATSTNFVVKVDETTPKIIIDGNVAKNGRESGDVFNPNGIAPTLLARDGKDPKKITVVGDNMKTKLANDLIDSGTVTGGEIINHSYTTSVNRPNLVDYIETDNGLSPCLTTRPDILGYVEKKVEKSNLRIRKLTPRECYRLMGFSDQAFDLAAPNQSNTSLYHQAGDSIVVDVLENILKELL